MVIVEDLESVVAKLTWFTEVRGRMWVGVEFLLIDGPDHPLHP